MQDVDGELSSRVQQLSAELEQIKNLHETAVKEKESLIKENEAGIEEKEKLVKAKAEVDALLNQKDQEVERVKEAENTLKQQMEASKAVSDA